MVGDAPAAANANTRSTTTRPRRHRANRHSILDTHCETRVACWNVRTLSTEQQQHLLADDLSVHNIDVAVISESRLTETGSMTLRGTHKSYQLYFSGGTTKDRGVAVAISQQYANSVTDIKTIDDRLMTVRMKHLFGHLTVVAAYAPTDASTAADKKDFYDRLYATTSQIDQHDWLIVAGDLNADVGTDNYGWENTMGRYGRGTRNDNGERLLEYCAFNNLRLTNTCFRHKYIHDYTFYSNDHRTKKLIDHVMVRRRMASSVMDSRVYRTTALSSDHKLVVARIRLKLRAPVTQRVIPKLNVAKLSDPVVRQQFQLETQNRFAALMDMPDDADTELMWSRFHSHILGAGKATLGTKPRTKSSAKLSIRTLELIEQKRSSPNLKRGQRRHLTYLIQKGMAEDAEAVWAAKATNIEQAAASHNMSQVYSELKSMCGKSGQISDVIKDPTGSLITDTERKLPRWREHFSTLLNRDPPATLSRELQEEADDAAPTDTIPVTPPTLQETSEAIRRLKAGKASGADDILPELLKCGGPATCEAMHKVLCNIWHTGQPPADWKQAIVLPFFKKGDKAECKNYRGISLLSVAGKILCSVINTRLRAWRNVHTREEQAGFRPGRGCVDQIFALRQTVEERLKYQQPTSIVFIDFAAAFDSVHRESLWQTMASNQVPAPIINIIRNLYDGSSSRVRAYGQLSEPFLVNSGVRQGCVLSPTLFNFVVDWILNTALIDHPGVLVGRATLPADEEGEVTFNEDLNITDLDFADDIALLASTPEEAEAALNRVYEEAVKLGLVISTAKTKVLHVGVENPTDLDLQGGSIASVEKFSYLGSSISNNGKAGDEVMARIGKATGAFRALSRPLWSRPEISLATKLRIYRASVTTILMYGCETWPLLAHDIGKLEAFDQRCRRHILHISWEDRVTNTEVYRRTRGTPIGQLIRQTRLRWLGHVARMPPVRLPARALAAEGKHIPGWQRRGGGQQTTWRDLIDKELRPLRPPGHKNRATNIVMAIHSQATNRQCWKGVIRDTCGFIEATPEAIAPS